MIKSVKALILIQLLTAFSILSNAQTADSLKKHSHFELSFGQSLLFISNSDIINIHKESAIVVPTSSMLFFVELRTDKFLRVPFFFNLPTESKQFLVNNQLVNEKASITCGTGLEFKLFRIKVDSKSFLDMEIGPLATVGFDKKAKIWYAPLIATRLRIIRGENFVMYLGGSYAFGVNAIGIFYGTGTVF